MVINMWLADRPVSVPMSQWSRVTLKRGRKGSIFFWRISVITLVSLNREWQNLAWWHIWDRCMFLRGQPRALFQDGEAPAFPKLLRPSIYTHTQYEKQQLNCARWSGKLHKCWRANYWGVNLLTNFQTISRQQFQSGLKTHLFRRAYIVHMTFTSENYWGAYLLTYLLTLQ